MRDREHVTGNHLPFWGLRYPGGFRARAILTASYRAPRELAWIAGVLLLPLLVGEAVTGNPLSASNRAILTASSPYLFGANLPYC